MKRFLIPLISLILLFSLSSCGKEKEKPGEDLSQGSFNPVEVSSSLPAEDYSEYNTFDIKKEPLGLDYKTISFPRSNQSFKVPSSFEEEIVTARYIRFKAGSSDPDLSGITFHLHFKTPVKEASAYYTDTPGFVKPDTASYLKSFTNEILYSTFEINGGTYGMDYIPSSAGVYDDSSKDGDICYFVYSDSGLVDRNTFESLHGYSSIAYVYIFSGIPAVWYTTFPSEKLETVKTLLSYIVSSVTYTPRENRAFITLEDSGFTFSLPPYVVKKDTKSHTLYFVPFENYAGSYSAMGVGIFDYESSKKIGFENIYTAFTGESAASIFWKSRDGFTENVDVNGYLADSLEVWSFQSGQTNGTAFFYQGTRAVARIYRFGSKAFVFFDCEDLYRDHFEEFYAKCLMTTFKFVQK